MRPKAPKKRAKIPVGGGERAFLSRLRQSQQGSVGSSGLVLGLGDDAALWRPRRGMVSALTTDLMVEGTHFNFSWMKPWHVGARAVAASLSDLAAMGAQPRIVLISLALPKLFWRRPTMTHDLMAGARAWAEAFGARIAGGDTTASRGPLVVDVMALGEVAPGRALRRSGARPGDALMVTGSLGDSAAGLAALRGLKKIDAPSMAWVAARHRNPLPRVQFGRLLTSRRLASACIDISDGLASEAWHLSRESAVAIDLDLDAIPFSNAMRRVAKALRKDPLHWALGGGEDYELLFTVPERKVAQVLHHGPRLAGCSVTQIGRVRQGKGVCALQGGKKMALSDQGWDHWL